MTDDVLTTEQIAKSYGPVVALRSVDLHVRPGEIHALLGANGAGKSTLVKILTGVIQPNSGRILIDGNPVTFPRPSAAQTQGLASVFQDPAMVPDLTVTQNLKLTGVDDREVRRWLTEMDLGHDELDAYVRDLPLPSLRLLDLARALSRDPRVLLLDEITAALPHDLAERVFTMMGRWKAMGRSVVFISHRLAEVRDHCDQCTVLRDGYNVDTFEPHDGGEKRIVAAMLGERAAAVAEATEVAPRADLSAAPVVLGVANLSAGQRLRDVSFQLHAGEVLGVVALEGQGQDLLFDVLAGNLPADGGVIEVNGSPLRARHPADAIRRGVCLVPSDRLKALFPQRSVRENIASSLLARIARWGSIDRRAERRSVDDAVQRMQIDMRAQGEVRQLSGGNQQKVTIARWLAHGFKVLLLFDPTRGIDVGTKAQVYALVRQLAAEGNAVLMFTSELREVASACDRAVVMHDGVIVAEMPHTASEEELLTAAHGLHDEPEVA